MCPARRSFLILWFLFATCGTFALAQPAPGGERGRRDSRSIVDQVERRAEPTVRANPLAAFARGLEKEAPALALSPAATAAVQEFVRDLQDFAALDDGHVRERAGLAPRTVRASVDVQRDLTAQADYANDLAAAGRDVVARWKKLRELLDERQRQRVDAVYSAALQGAYDVEPRK